MGEARGRGVWWVSMLRTWRALGANVRAVLGIRRGVMVDGVYYKELNGMSLGRALSRRGPGYKDYRATFSDGRKQVIRCGVGAAAEGEAPARAVYADLMGSAGIDRLDPVLRRVRPGSRVLEFGAGTGYRALWLSLAVGPSGAVVALAEHGEHIEYAKKRYERDNIAFETADGFALSGETDGSFEMVIALAMTSPRDRAVVKELWRLVAPGGAMLIGPAADLDAMKREVMEATGAEEGQIGLSRTGAGATAVTDLLVSKRREDDGGAGR